MKTIQLTSVLFLFISFPSFCNEGLKRFPLFPELKTEANLSIAEKAIVEICLEGDLFDSTCGVEVEVVGRHLVYGGDMIMGSSEEGHFISRRGNVISGSLSVWPNGRVPYVLTKNNKGGEMSDAFRKDVRKAVQTWEDAVNTRGRTFIKFVEISSTAAVKENNWVEITEKVEGTRNFANLGAKYRNEMLSESSALLHEFGHVLGLVHEHQRKDRNDYITVNYGNIPDERHSDFNTDTFPSKIEGKFDFDSVMLYSSTTFASKGNSWVRKSDGKAFGGNYTLSAGDAAAVQSLYASSANREVEKPIAPAPPVAVYRPEPPKPIDNGLHEEIKRRIQEHERTSPPLPPPHPTNGYQDEIKRRLAEWEKKQGR